MNVEKRVIPPEPVEPEVEFVVTLTKQEAEDLWVLFGRIGGFPQNTVRETTDPMWEQLSTALDVSYKAMEDFRRQDRYKDLPSFRVNDKY